MTSVYKLKLADLNEAFLQELKRQFANAEVEVYVNTPRAWTQPEEDWFWSIIALLDWDKEGDDDAVLAPAVAQLAVLPIRSILLFADILSEKLYKLDAQVFAENMGAYSFREGYYFSVDDFLYARCCVIANGRVAYENVLEDPTQMPEEKTFESLLRLAAEAYRIKTGQPMAYVPAYNIETFSNEEGWANTEQV
ncbi:MAG TPA: DUF4240 domain-containing protein [Saprospiraceae bacterium]|nr:DUF4240 domain-containing protein [Saprospiraceae bacterium]HMP23658.1 DUF4240 domain-containing protein [Saprospiraceae bacterium]